MIKLANLLKESSWSRIYSHISRGGSFAVVSAFREYNSPEKNVELHEKLKQEVRGMGLGFIEQKSVYTYTNPETGKEGPTEEYSLFIPKASLKQTLDLGKKYDQETVIYKDEKQFSLINSSTGEKVMDFSKEDRPMTFDPQVLKYANSQLLRANKSQKGQYAFKGLEELYELALPERSEYFLAQKNRSGYPKARWKKV